MGSLEDAVLHNANQFHKWHTELEAACASETEEKYRQYAQLLQGHLASCDKLQDQVRCRAGRGGQQSGLGDTHACGSSHSGLQAAACKQPSTITNAAWCCDAGCWCVLTILTLLSRAPERLCWPCPGDLHVLLQARDSRSHMR